MSRQKKSEERRAKGFGCIYRPTYKAKGGELQKQSTWWIKYRRPGEAKPRFESAHTANRYEAEGLLNERLADIRAGKAAAPDVTKTTFEDLARLIVTDYEANDRDTLVRVEQHLEHLRAKFGGNLAVAITADRIGAYKAERKKAGAANATINRELACLKHSFRLAANVRKVGFVPHIAMLKEAAARSGFFEADQFANVVAKLPVDL